MSVLASRVWWCICRDCERMCLCMYSAQIASVDGLVDDALGLLLVEVLLDVLGVDERDDAVEPRKLFDRLVLAYRTTYDVSRIKPNL